MDGTGIAQKAADTWRIMSSPGSLADISG